MVSGESGRGGDLSMGPGLSEGCLQWTRLGPEGGGPRRDELRSEGNPCLILQEDQMIGTEVVPVREYGDPSLPHPDVSVWGGAPCGAHPPHSMFVDTGVLVALRDSGVVVGMLCGAVLPAGQIHREEA